MRRASGENCLSVRLKNFANYLLSVLLTTVYWLLSFVILKENVASFHQDEVYRRYRELVVAAAPNGLNR